MEFVLKGSMFQSREQATSSFGWLIQCRRPPAPETVPFAILDDQPLRNHYWIIVDSYADAVHTLDSCPFILHYPMLTRML